MVDAVEVTVEIDIAWRAIPKPSGSPTEERAYSAHVQGWHDAPHAWPARWRWAGLARGVVLTHDYGVWRLHVGSGISLDAKGTTPAQTRKAIREATELLLVYAMDRVR